MANYYIGGVGRVQAFINGKNGLEHYFDAKTLTDSAINISVSAEEIRGGEGAQLLGKYFHTSVFNLSMTDALFDIKYLAAQIGSEINEGATANYFKTEELAAEAGVVTLSETAVSVIDASKWCADTESDIIAWVKNCDGGYDTYPVNGGKITIPGSYSGNVCVTYPIKKEGRQIVVNAMYYPKEFVVYLTAKLFAGDACTPSKGTYVGEVVVEIPRFQLDGTVDLGLNMSSPATFALNGSAYANGCGCDDEPWYAKITEVLVDSDDPYKGYNGIAVLNSEELHVGDKVVIYAIESNSKKMPKLYNGAFTAIYDSDKPAIDENGIIVSGATGTVTVTASDGALKNKTTTFTIQA